MSRSEDRYHRIRRGIDEVKRRVCDNCVDKTGIPVNVNGSVVMMKKEKDPCEDCGVRLVITLAEEEK